MAKFLMFVAIAVALSSCNKNSFANIFQPDITICNLQQQPSVYADSLIELNSVTVTKCSGLYKFYYGEITDGQCNVAFISNKPFHIGEKVNIEGRFEIVAQQNSVSSSVFVDGKTNELLSIIKLFGE